MSSSEHLEHHDGHATDSGLVSDMFSVDFKVLGPLNSTVAGKSDHHLKYSPSGQEHNTDQILVACMSQQWHRGPNHSLSQLDEPNTSEHGSDAGSDGEDSNVPLEDEVTRDESDVIDLDLLDQQCNTTICDELREDFEARYAKIGVCTSIPKNWWN